jgi:uncharacterized MAPEG superfamily protein
MNSLPVLVVLSVVLTWITLMTASALKIRPWTAAGRPLGFGNREVMPEPSLAAGRADRASKNTLENFVMFMAAIAAAKWAGVADDRLVAAAQLFFWSRVAYFLVYVAGIRYVRTVAWVGGVVAIAMIIRTVC